MSLEDTNKKGLDSLSYWSETDCYYYIRGDSNSMDPFTVTDVVVSEDGAYQVYYERESYVYIQGFTRFIITLMPREDSTYRIISNLPA